MITEEKDTPRYIKCPSCGNMVLPIINIKDDELFNDYAWAECPDCHFNTGNRENEIDALRFFENPGRPQPWSVEDPMPDYEQVFESFWKGIVLAEDRSPKIDQIKRELFDAHIFMDGAAIVYSHITGGLISKVTTDPSCVIQVADDHYEEIHREWEEEERTVTLECLSEYFLEWVKKNNIPYVEPWCLSFIQDLSKKAKSEIIEADEPDKEVSPTYIPKEDLITEYMRQIEMTDAVGGLIDPEHYDELAGILRRMLSEEFGLEQDLADWLWIKFMDWCKKRGVAPANYNDLFYIIKELRSMRK